MHFGYVPTYILISSFLNFSWYSYKLQVIYFSFYIINLCIVTVDVLMAMAFIMMNSWHWLQTLGRCSPTMTCTLWEWFHLIISFLMEVNLPVVRAIPSLLIVGSNDFGTHISYLGCHIYYSLQHNLSTWLNWMTNILDPYYLYSFNLIWIFTLVGWTKRQCIY